uniref:Uncharacterized protein n=1 Tax=Arundo donax TaxID=35708 RepID=A0A0A9DWA6_ARUDO
MSSTRDGRGRGTDTFIDLYSLLRFALRPFDDPMTVEGPLALSESSSEFFPSSDVALSSFVGFLLILAESVNCAAEISLVTSILFLPSSVTLCLQTSRKLA